MYTTGSSELGLALRGDDLDYFVKKYTELNPDEFKTADDPIETMWNRIQENDSFKCGVGDASFEGTWMQDDPFYPHVYLFPIKEKEEYQQIELPVLKVIPDKWLSSREVLKGNFYKSADELVDEFRRKCGKYLPPDFDWAANIGDIDYAVFC